MNLRKALVAAALGGAMGLPGAASALEIDGITFELGSIIEAVKIFEAERFGDSVGNDNGVIDNVGEELIGIGRVLEIARPAELGGGVLWSAGDNGRELTVYFHSFITEIIDLSGPLPAISFSGGVVEIYSDATPNFSAAGTQAAGIATATDGTLWLSLTGSPIGGSGPTGNPITLLSTSFGSLTNAFVLGGGLLDVNALADGRTGSANSIFDTNTFGCFAIDGENCPDDADKTFTSSGQLGLPSSGDGWGFEGTVDIKDYGSIPEPGTLALLGAGLMGLGMRRRKVA